MPAIDMTPYCGDDYDRAGCRGVIDVTKFGYTLSVYAPNGAPMEFYPAVKSSAEISRMLNEWLNGQVPRPRRLENQLSESESKS